jgi:hypothetical protein
MARSKYETAGEQPRLIKFSDSAAEQTLPVGCVAIYPLDGCQITSLKRSDSNTNWALGTASAGFLNIATFTFATGKLYPIKVANTDKNSDNYFTWSKITLGAGECLAIFE